MDHSEVRAALSAIFEPSRASGAPEYWSFVVDRVPPIVIHINEKWGRRAAPADLERLVAPLRPGEYLVNEAGEILRLPYGPK